MAEIDVVVCSASDSDMAVLALVENVSRENLTDYEIGRALRVAEAEFPSRTRMADAMGLSRSSLYRYLAYEKLPDFMLRDMDVRPELLAGNAASAVGSALSKLGERGLAVAVELWPHLVGGEIEQMKLAPLMEAAVAREGRESPPAVQRDSRKLFARKGQVGSIQKDARHLTVKIKAEALTDEQEAQLRELVAKFCRELPT